MTTIGATSGQSSQAPLTGERQPNAYRSTMSRWPLVLAAALLTACQVAGPALTHSPARPAVQTQAAKRAVVPAGYYASVESLTGDRLLKGLAAIIGKHKDLGYDKARDVMFADLDDTTGKDQVQSVYTGAWATGVTSSLTAYNKGFNTEHTWPQSKGAEGVAKADLHHLYSVDAKSNGIRSNNPFGNVVTVLMLLPDVTHSGQASKLGKDANGTQVFETPDWHRGDVARSLMYFFVRYATAPKEERGGGPLTLVNFEVERRILKAWHDQDPVDANERQRNDAIYGLQGNRNPFVDHPEYVDRVGSPFLPH